MLARVLVCLVMLFVLAFSVSSGSTVLISNALQLASKTHEIGILRAHGLSAGQIVGLFAFQGLTAGLGAFVVGGLLVAAAEPWTSAVVRATFRLPEQALPVRLADVSQGPLFALALLLAVFATTTGAVLPAWWASRLTPVEAMQRRD